MNTHTADEERGGLIIKQVRDEHKGTYVAVYIDNVKLLCTANTRSFFQCGAAILRALVPRRWRGVQASSAQRIWRQELTILLGGAHLLD